MPQQREVIYLDVQQFKDRRLNRQQRTCRVSINQRVVIRKTRLYQYGQLSTFSALLNPSTPNTHTHTRYFNLLIKFFQAKLQARLLFTRYHIPSNNTPKKRGLDTSSVNAYGDFFHHKFFSHEKKLMQQQTRTILTASYKRTVDYLPYDDMEFGTVEVSQYAFNGGSS